MKGHKRYDKNTIHLPRQHLPQPHGRICHERSRAKSRPLPPDPGGLRRNEQRGNRQPDPLRNPAQAAGKRDPVRRSPRPPHDKT